MGDGMQPCRTSVCTEKGGVSSPLCIYSNSFFFHHISVMYNFKCDQCDAGYVGNTRGHLFVRVDGNRSKTSSVRKHYDNKHPGKILDDLHSCFNVLKKCQNKFDCLVNEMLLIQQLRLCLNVQSDSIRAKVFV